MSRIGAFATSFDYQYWPLSKARWASVLLLMAMVPGTVFAAQSGTDVPPWWLIIVLLAAMIWGWVGCADCFSEKRAAHRSPLDYGDRDLE